jgi:hypothetical protein
MPFVDLQKLNDVKMLSESRFFYRKFSELNVFFLMALFIFAGCSSTDQVIEEEDRRSYVSYTGSDQIKEQIKDTFESVKRIHNSVIYRTYRFDESALPTRGSLERANFRRIAKESFVDDHSNAGTAIVLSNRFGRTTLLTAAHTVTFPDTVWHYRRGGSGELQDLVEAVSVKQSSTHFILSESGILSFEVAVSDSRRDLALLLKRWTDGENPGLKPLEIEPGNHASLDWTDLVYALGYPKGVQMVTSAMVSKFSISSRRSFVLDSSFNRGFSGGALFTVRSDGMGLEWVGILSAAYAENEYYLAPEAMADEDYDPNLPYDGELYPRRVARINYGITYAVGMEQIGDFFRENRDRISSFGLSVPNVPR